MSNEITVSAQAKGFSLTPQSLSEAMQFAEVLSKSSIVPKDYINNPGNVIVAMQWGMELGLQPLQAMQNIAVINGRPSIWGDAILAIVRGSGLLESINEDISENEATCVIKRRGEAPVSRCFSMEDAKKVGLANKAGPWTQYPKRMMQMRARAFALRDVFSDVLRGIHIAEEAQDMTNATIIDHGTGEIVNNKPAPLPAYTAEQFDIALPKWQVGIDSGKLTPEKIIAAASSKYTLSAAQIAAISTMKPTPVAEVVKEPSKDFLADSEDMDNPF